MRRARPLGVAVVGLGFMGRTHLAAYRAADGAGFPNRVVAVHDRRAAGPRDVRGNLPDGGAALDLGDARVHARFEDVLADDAVELVSLCTPTDAHVDQAIAALEAGKHVLVEKPVALASADVRRLAQAARAARGRCLPAMCMRFWPGWDWLKDEIEAGTFGAVKSAVFRRLASRPSWSDFYHDRARSGGALFDLHVHDADFVRWCFGAPDGVHAVGTRDHVTAAYRYADGPQHVVAEGGWDHAPGFAFRMGYTVVFDEATADFDCLRGEPLVLARAGETRALPLAPGTGYDGEVRHAIALCTGRDDEPRATVDEAVGLTAMLEAEAAMLP